MKLVVRSRYCSDIIWTFHEQSGNPKSTKNQMMYYSTSSSQMKSFQQCYYIQSTCQLDQGTTCAVYSALLLVVLVVLVKLLGVAPTSFANMHFKIQAFNIVKITGTDLFMKSYNLSSSCMLR
jgi:hypothetical protein